MAEPLLIQARYRNRLEKSVGQQLSEAGVRFKYEPRTIPVMIPARKSTYLPDFVIEGKELLPQNPLADRLGVNVMPIILETKGYFYNGAKDRQKLILLKEQHPNLDIRIVFQNASKPIYKGSPTTYGQWATDHGFKWADKGIVPKAWLDEMKGNGNGPAKRRPRKAQ